MKKIEKKHVYSVLRNRKSTWRTQYKSKLRWLFEITFRIKSN